jgi:O-antigen ligase
MRAEVRDSLRPAAGRGNGLRLWVRLKEARYPVETALLLGLCFFLPLLEAPKNLLWLAYAATWLVNRVRARDFGGPWDLWDSLIGVWIASGFVVAAFAGLDGTQWWGAGDLLRYGSLLWLVKRARYDRRQIRSILGMLVASTVVGLAIGHGQLLSGRATSGTLELHSVGHVNHTAIYLAIMLAVCTAWLFSRWRAWRAGTRAVALSVIALVIVSLVVSASRGAIGVGLALLPILAAAWWPRSRMPMAISAVVVAVVSGIAVFGGAEVIRKHFDDVQADNVLAYRDGIWRVALVAWSRHPWFGVGMDNYSRITPERIRAWDADASRPHDPGRYYFTTHGHSIYANTLAERGAVGAAVLAVVLIAWAVFLAGYRPRRTDPDEEWLVWGCAAGAWFITTAVGLVNTTLHHEHGMLAAILLGLWLSRLPARRAS